MFKRCREELWSVLWEQCSSIDTFVEALGDAAVRGELSASPPSPDSTQVCHTLVVFVSYLITLPCRTY